MNVSDLPAVNATLNGLSTVFLTLGFIFIKQGKRVAHQRCMVSALVTSALFLACYLFYHYHAGSTPFEGQGWIRPVYFVILISHILLAVVILPFIFMAFFRAFRGEFEKHRKVVRITWPLWMYVSVTGVLIYFMLYHWFRVAA